MSPLKFFSGTSKWRRLLLVTLIILVWLSLWYFPWQRELHHIFWFQLGIGLVIFIIPGFCVYGLLSDNLKLEFNYVTFGFVISHLIFAVLGMVGRFIHLSFNAIAFLMMILGLILLIVYLLPKIDNGIKFQMDRERSAYILSILPILFVSLLVSLIVIQRVLTDDDLTYLAYITNWQHSSRLDFNDPIFGKAILAQPRFWLMSTPFAEALLAEISRMPAILILCGYYEPFLVLLSVLCWYELAIALKLSPITASASVILQLSFLLLLSEYLHPGAPYFEQLSADKATAAFILAPVFFQSLIKLLEEPSKNNKLLFLMVGLSLTFMHPIILAYAVFIGGIFILVNKSSLDFRNKLIPIVILIVILIPQIMIRFIGVLTVETIAFDPEVVLNQSGSDSLIDRWGNTRFYGFNLDILALTPPYEANIPLPESILKWAWILVPLLAVISALKQRERLVTQFIISCFALCFLAGFPFTGWIIGYFLNARMLARSVWLFPFGISSVYLFVIIINKLWVTSDAKSVRILSKIGLLIALTIFSSALFLLFLRESSPPDFEKFSLKSIRYQGISKAGQTLDQLIPSRAVVIGSQSLNDLIPGISWKSQIITFRIQLPAAMAYFTVEERGTRVSDTQQIFSQLTSVEERMTLLRKYEVRFLLLQRGDLKIFNDLMASYPDQFTATEIGGVYLIQIH